jgi:hypothetical protein
VQQDPLCVYSDLPRPLICDAGLYGPAFQLFGDPPCPEIDRLRTNLFREQVGYSAVAKERLVAARKDGAEAMPAIEGGLGGLDDVDASVLVDQDHWEAERGGTLMEIREPGGALEQPLVPVVRYANRRRIDDGVPDPSAQAKRLVLGIIGHDRLMHQSRAERGETIGWADESERELLSTSWAVRR